MIPNATEINIQINEALAKLALLGFVLESKAQTSNIMRLINGNDMINKVSIQSKTETGFPSND